MNHSSWRKSIRHSRYKYSEPSFDVLYKHTGNVNEYVLISKDMQRHICFNPSNTSTSLCSWHSADSSDSWPPWRDHYQILRSDNMINAAVAFRWEGPVPCPVSSCLSRMPIYKKGKAHPLQAMQAQRRLGELRFLDFLTSALYGKRLSASRTGRLYSFSRGGESTPGPWFSWKEICHWKIQ
jgi:hypothetical protein